MKLEKLEKASALARKQAQNLKLEADRARQTSRAARNSARQAKSKLKQTKREAKLTRQAAKLAKRAYGEAQRSLEKAVTLAVLTEKKLQKARQKVSKATERNGESKGRPRAAARPPKPRSATVRRSSTVAASKSPRRAALATKPAKLVAAGSESRVPVPREWENRTATPEPESTTSPDTSSPAYSG